MGISMSNSFSPQLIRRYRISTIFCSLILILLLISLDTSSWRTIETTDRKLLMQFYSPLQYDSSRISSTNKNKTFRLDIGPLWRCLTIEIHGKQMSIDRECTMNKDSFDYVIISIGIGTFILFTMICLCISSGCLISPIGIIRLAMSFILELATLWLIYGFFHIQKVLGPLYGWGSIGFFIGIISVIVICVLEWDDYFRDIYRTNCSSRNADRNQRLNTCITETIHTDIERI